MPFARHEKFFGFLCKGASDAFERESAEGVLFGRGHTGAERGARTKGTARVVGHEGAAGPALFEERRIEGRKLHIRPPMGRFFAVLLKERGEREALPFAKGGRQNIRGAEDALEGRFERGSFGAGLPHPERRERAPLETGETGKQERRVPFAEGGHEQRFVAADGGGREAVKGALAAEGDIGLLFRSPAQRRVGGKEHAGDAAHLGKTAGGDEHPFPARRKDAGNALGQGKEGQGVLFQDEGEGARGERKAAKERKAFGIAHERELSARKAGKLRFRRLLDGGKQKLILAVCDARGRVSLWYGRRNELHTGNSLY